MKTAAERSEIYTRLLRYAKPYRGFFAIAALSMLLFSATEVTFMWLMKPLLDGSFVERDPTVMAIMPFAVVILFLFRGVAGYTTAFTMALIGRGVVRDMKSAVFAHLVHIPVTRYEEETPGKMIARLTAYTESVAGATTTVVTAVIRDGLKVIGLVGLMFYLSVALASFTLIAGPLIAFSVKKIGNRFRSLHSRVQDSAAELTDLAHEIIDGREVVKLFGGGPTEIEKFDDANARNRSLQLKLVSAQAANSAVIQLIAAVAIGAIVYVATKESMMSQMTPGTFVAFMGATMSLLTPLKSLTGISAVLNQGIVAADSIFEFLDHPGENDTGSTTLARGTCKVEYKNVTFRYPSTEDDVIRNVSLVAPPEATIALVGASGGGKSTFVKLLTRLYEIDSGTIEINGTDIREYSLASLRRSISYVSQNVMIFNDSVRNNIAYGGAAEMDDDAIMEAARLAHAWEFIKDMPDQLEAPLGKNGLKLSGGQRQRIAIARALMKDAPILILDEATSALDNESERLVQHALDELLAKRRTTFVIAHRLSTVANADAIAVVEGGEIVEFGTHEELAERDGRFRALLTSGLDNAPDNA